MCILQLIHNSLAYLAIILSFACILINYRWFYTKHFTTSVLIGIGYVFLPIVYYCIILGLDWDPVYQNVFVLVCSQLAMFSLLMECLFSPHVHTSVLYCTPFFCTICPPSEARIFTFLIESRNVYLHLHRICLFLSLFNWHWLVFIPLPLRVTLLSGCYALWQHICVFYTWTFIIFIFPNSLSLLCLQSAFLIFFSQDLWLRVLASAVQMVR